VFALLQLMIQGNDLIAWGIEYESSSLHIDTGNATAFASANVHVPKADGFRINLYSK